MRAFAPLVLASVCLAACQDPSAQPLERKRDSGAKTDGGLGDARVAADARTDAEAMPDPEPEVVLEDDTGKPLLEKLALNGKLDAKGLRARWPAKFSSGLGYDPTTAAGLDTIAASRFALNDAEREKLREHGFVISARNTFPTTFYGLAQLYSEDLPVYVSADALLEAVHVSYDGILLSLETRFLQEDLAALLRGMRQRLSTSTQDARLRADVDLYLGVALALLEEKPPTAVAGGNVAEMKHFTELATQASGLATVTLFGTERDEDFSQFKPRGHYEFVLEGYFRAMMWLGRFDFRLLETVEGGGQEFRRQHYLAMLLVRELMGSDADRYTRIDETVRTFVGESDYMTPEEVDSLVADLGGLATARAASDEQVIAALNAGDYGKQHIMSTISPRTVEGMQLPLNRSFALLGQRYVIDSHVFGEVVHDRVVKRMMPTPLDQAFAALGNAQVLKLHPEIDGNEPLSNALGAMRTLVDGHDEAFWSANLYNLWLSALRTLSPARDLATNTDLPAVARTEAWGRRMLNTQLGSWAELRHDTLLYAKQSYTFIPACEFPDAYVDPYPAFYAALQKFAQAGNRVFALFANEPAASDGTLAVDYFDRLGSAASTLREMAERELRGEPFSAEQLAWVNDAVRVRSESAGCASIEVGDGWLAKLYFDPLQALEYQPTIADVHTQPADEEGKIVGKVLHVAVGNPRLMVTTVDTCNGPRAYAGVVFAYHEKTSTGFQRFSDLEWNQALSRREPQPDPSWVNDLLSQ